MSILEPQQSVDAEDPLLDAVVGLYAYAHQVTDVVTRIAPAIEPRLPSTDSLDAFTALLLGIIATSASIQSAIADAAPAVRDNTHAPPRAMLSEGSLWR